MDRYERGLRDGNKFMMLYVTIFHFLVYLCLCHDSSHIDEDRQAFLGKRKGEFDELSIEESSRRLR